MGMDAYLYSISDDLYERAKEHPNDAYALIFAGDNSRRHDGFINLQESWQCLHFLLSGHPHHVDESRPITKAVLGGTEVGDEVFGLDQLRFLSPSEVRKIADALAKTDPASLVANFSADDFREAELYKYDGQFDELSAHLIQLYRKIANFYKKASKKGNAVVGYIS